MTQSATIATMDVLRHFGFEPNDTRYPGDDRLVFRFKNFALDADLTVNQYSQPRVLFSAELRKLNSYRTIQVPTEFYLPTHVISYGQCAAMIAYYLGQVQDPPRWLIEGRQSADLLPWRIEEAARRAAYDARPKCYVAREWLRLALKTLSAEIASLIDDMPVVFQFRDGVFTIGCNGKMIVATATGTSWPEEVAVSAEKLRKLPMRFVAQEICVFVADAYLWIGKASYPRIIGEAGNRSNESG